MSGLLENLPHKSRLWYDITYEECDAMLFKGREIRAQANDRTKWNGKIIGKHLFAAGKSYERKERYDFPGYMNFPINLYT